MRIRCSRDREWSKWRPNVFLIGLEQGTPPIRWNRRMEHCTRTALAIKAATAPLHRPMKMPGPPWKARRGTVPLTGARAVIHAWMMSVRPGPREPERSEPRAEVPELLAVVPPVTPAMERMERAEQKVLPP